MSFKAQKVLICLLNGLKNVMPLTYRTFFKVFDAKLSPILLYGSEIWGLENIDSIEKVHTYACKRFLNIPLNSINNVVLGDCGRYPMYIASSKRCIKYWLKILEMPEDRYVKKCYKMLRYLDEVGHKNWVTKVKENLCSNGFGYVWENQSVVDAKHFIIFILIG